VRPRDQVGAAEGTDLRRVGAATEGPHRVPEHEGAAEAVPGGERGRVLEGDDLG
jgi:hypothetical protein